jgi:hypothetical protein
MPVLTRFVSAASDAAGSALGAAAEGVAAVRAARKPLHPHGQVVAARVHRRGVQPGTGVAWLDEPGDDDVLVRV